MIRQRSTTSGFSLIELLVVIAITLVLLTLLFGPLITGFRLTTQAQITTEAQDASRVALEQISREIGSAAGVRDTGHEYINMRMYTKNSAGTADEVIAHAYNAYLDIVPPGTAPPKSGTTKFYISDPTVNADTGQRNYYLKQNPNGSSALVSNGLTLPLTPGKMLVRYFVGLRHPINFGYVPGGSVAAEEQPYTNRDEGQLFLKNGPAGPTTGIAWGSTETAQKNINNGYILYRAAVSIYKQLPSGKYGVNSDFFDTDSSGNPILDDPDFFRVTADTAHNNRLYHWYQAAKPIIDVGDVNLIFQPHDGKGNVVYDNTTGYLAGTALDKDGSPIIRTSVSFGPASVSNDPLNPTATSDVSQGYGSSPGDVLAPYIPTEYKGQFGQWQGAPIILISDSAANSYTTYVYHPASGATPAAGYHDGDLIESLGSTDVFDVSTDSVIGTPANYVVMSVNGNAGTINFSMPDLPVTSVNGSTPSPVATTPVGSSSPQTQAGDADSSNAANPYWFVTFGTDYTAGADGSSGTVVPPLQIHLKPQPQLPSYNQANDKVLLPNPALSGTNTLPNITTQANGRVVVNSERVYGPEQESGPGHVEPTAAATGNPANYPLVPYHRITFDAGTVGSIGDDQYMIDYDHGIIYLGSAGPGKNIDNTDTFPQRRTVLVAYSFQNNDVVNTDATTHEITGETADTVRATYQSGSRLQVSIGVRLYDPSTGRPTYFNLTNAVGVGNAAR